jgi:hypothetical protein
LEENESGFDGVMRVKAEVNGVDFLVIDTVDQAVGFRSML